MICDKNMPPWIEYLNTTVLSGYQTRLVGGFSEPFYQAPINGSNAEIRFTRDYERSALHELGHWCIAGELRRTKDDYGYWYVPDGRTAAQQHRFFDVEIKPQAVEKYFCTALGIGFEVSADNLGDFPKQDTHTFSQRVQTRYTRYLATGFPHRANEIYHCLRSWQSVQTCTGRSSRACA